MDYFPPEKYYEACVTYHIVRYYEENFDERDISLQHQSDSGEKGRLRFWLSEEPGTGILYSV